VYLSYFYGVFFVSIMSDTFLEMLALLSWNVRGLNDPDRCSTVSESISASSCSIACLQESKLQNIDAASAAFVGGFRLRAFAQLPAIGTKGGVLVLWDDSLLQGSDIAIGSFCISLTLKSTRAGFFFRLTSVYGPTRSSRKDEFFPELLAHKPSPGTKWIVNGDFNQIYRARDKNKGNINRRRLNRFRDTLQACELNEIPLQNRRFTWSNERLNPTLSKLDAVFCNHDCDIALSDHILHALSSSLSDHCPLLLACA
jgi:exonuclease III